jgi:hypothetical protein
MGRKLNFAMYWSRWMNYCIFFSLFHSCESILKRYDFTYSYKKGMVLHKKKYYFKKYISNPIDNLKINYTRIHTYTYTNICVL